MLHEGPPPTHTETPQGLPGTGRDVRRRQAAAPGPGAAFLGVFLSHCCFPVPTSKLASPKALFTGACIHSAASSPFHAAAVPS